MQIEDFEKLNGTEIIGSVVDELKSIWIKHGMPSGTTGPTTEIPSGAMRVGYWNEFEYSDEMYADYYNNLLDELLYLVDVRNIASRNNPIWYTQYYHDVGFEEYYEEAIDVISGALDSVYNLVCGVDVDTLRKMGYENTAREDDE